MRSKRVLLLPLSASLSLRVLHKAGGDENCDWTRRQCGSHWVHASPSSSSFSCPGRPLGSAHYPHRMARSWPSAASPSLRGAEGTRQPSSTPNSPGRWCRGATQIQGEWLHFRLRGTDFQGRITDAVIGSTIAWPNTALCCTKGRPRACPPQLLPRPCHPEALAWSVCEYGEGKLTGKDASHKQGRGND
jgi:hypothetical protein